MNTYKLYNDIIKYGWDNTTYAKESESDEEKSDEEKLDGIDIKVIESYVRKKKLKNINKK